MWCTNGRITTNHIEFAAGGSARAIGCRWIALTNISSITGAIQVTWRLHFLCTVLTVPPEIADAVIRIVSAVMRALYIALFAAPPDVACARTVLAHAVIATLLRAIPIAALD